MTPQMKRVQIARTTLLLDQPFFGVLALQLALIEDTTCETAWTDGRSMGFSPAFVDSLTPDELVAVIAHEVMHCACGHPWRRDSREMQRWNIAADYAINDLLNGAQFKLPKSALLDPQYAGKWAEWIYDRIPPQPQGGNGAGNDPSRMGEVRDAPAEGDAPTESDWQQATQQSLNAAKAQGKLPSNLARQLIDAVKPRVDWRSLLRRFVQEVVKADYSWSRPNVRYIPSGLYLPSLHSIACGRIAVGIDTSGSIDSVLLAQFVAEVQAIASELQPSSVDVIYCDAAINRVDTFARGELIEAHPCGGGGTNFCPVFDHLESDPPVVLVYLTDMCGLFPTEAPEYPVIWCSNGGTDAPFGEVVPCA